MATDCCGCFGFSRNHAGKEPKPTIANIQNRFSGEHLLGFSVEEIDKATNQAARKATKSPLNLYYPPYDDSATLSNGLSESGSPMNFPFNALRNSAKVSQFDAPGDHQTLQMPVKETRRVHRSEDFDGKKMVNEYVREYKLATGSYGKVVLHRSKKDDMLYAIKIFHKSRLCKLRVSPTETAMVDVLREVAIMKRLDHPNVVKLVEVMDDPQNDQFFMVLEYVEGGWVFEGSGPPGGIGESVTRRYFRDVVAGLIYLHNHNVIHGDIKPENLLIGGDGHIKICDFGVSRIFEGTNDELRRSPGTPVYTAPECCQGSTYHGKAADVWALGCTLYCMVLGRYPYKGDTLQSTYEKIVRDPLYLPDDLNPDLTDLLRGLLCKDVTLRLTLDAVANHAWVVQSYGLVQT